MLLVNQTWNLSTGSTLGATVNCFGQGIESMIYVSCNADSSVTTATLQSAIDPSGPWATIASTKVGTTNTAGVMQFSGPLHYVRTLASGVLGTATITLVTYGD